MYSNLVTTATIPKVNSDLFPLAAPFSSYEFQVQEETAVGPGQFSPARRFSTPEDRKSHYSHNSHTSTLQATVSTGSTEPRNLVVMYTSSTSLRITWEPPLCDYGIRTGYTVRHIWKYEVTKLEQPVHFIPNRLNTIPSNLMERWALPPVHRAFLRMQLPWISQASPSTLSTM